MVSLSLSFHRMKVTNGRTCSACAQTNHEFYSAGSAQNFGPCFASLPKSSVFFPHAQAIAMYWLGYIHGQNLWLMTLFLVFSKVSINSEKCDFSWVKSAARIIHFLWIYWAWGRRTSCLLRTILMSARLCREISMHHLHHGLGLHKQTGEEHTYLR